MEPQSRSRSPERPEEAFARTAVEAHLGGRGTWSLGADPPDFQLQLNGRSWAIEVTAVVDAAALKLPEQLRRVADEVEQRARGEGTLRRGYALLSTGGIYPLSRREHSRLVDALLSVVRQNGDEEEVAVGEGRYVVRAVGDRPRFGWWASFGEMRASQGAAAALRGSLEEIIRNKANRLRNVEGPKILLVVNCEHLAAQRDLLPALVGLRPEPFAAVYLIRSQAEVMLVAGEDELKGP